MCSALVVLGDAIDFVFGAQNHAHALMQLGGFNVQNTLLANSVFWTLNPPNCMSA